MKKRTYLIAATIASNILLSACSDTETAQVYIEQANQSITENKITESIIALKNAIKIEPENGQARYLLGQLYLEQGNALNAVKELEKAKAYKYDANLVLAKLARAYYLSDDTEGVINLVDKIEGLSLDAKKNISFYSVLSYLKADDVDAAKAASIALSNLDSSSGLALLATAQIKLFEQDLPAAKALAEEALSKLPNQPEATLLLGNIASVNNEFKIASEYYAKYLALQPQQKATEIMLANAYLQFNEFELAEKHADNILALASEQPFANHIKAMTRIQDKDYENASKHAEKAIANKFNHASTRLVAGVSAFYLKNYEQANFHIKPLLEFLPEDHFARKMLAVSQVELGMLEGITDTIGSSNVEVNDSDFYSAISYKLLQAGAKDEAKQLIPSLREDEQSPKELLRDGVLRVLTNDKSAIESIEKAVELDPTLVKGELMLAYLAINSGDVAKAKEISLKWQQTYPDKADGYNLESAIALKNNDMNLALTHLAKGLSIDPDNVYALLQTSQIYARQNNREKAIEYINKAYDVSPNNINVLRQYYQYNLNDETLAVLAAAAKDNSDDVNYSLIYVEALMKANNIEKGLGVLSEIKADHKTPKFYWMLKVAGYRQTKNITLLKATLTDWIKVNPYQIEPAVYLADIYVIERKFNDAITVLNTSLEKHSNDLTLQLAKLEVLVRAGKPAPARKLYHEFADKITNKNMIQGIEGKLALLENNHSVAVELLSSFYKNSPSLQNAMYLTSAYIGNGQKKEAIDHLTLLTEQTGFNANVFSILGMLYLELNDQSNALRAYEKIAEFVPTNVVALNNAAWLSIEQGKAEQANKYAQQAYKLSPELPDVVDTLSQVLWKSNQPEEALFYAKEAYTLADGKSPEIALNYIELLVAMKKNNEARIRLSQLIVETAEHKKRKQLIEKQLNI